MKKVVEKVFKNHPKYKGSIRYAKLIIAGQHHKVEKRRPFGWESYSITKEEHDYINNRKKAEDIWAYHHYGVNASDQEKHPLTGKSTMEEFELEQAITP